MLNFFKEIDQFGVQEKLQIPPIDPTQKSALGGISTLTLYTLSLAYFIYQLIDWQSNNKLPKYSSMMTKISEDETISCTDVFAEFQYFQILPKGSIDPFDPKNLIFQPVLTKIPSDWNQAEIVDLEFQQEEKEDGTYFNKYLIKNITLQGQPEYVAGTSFKKIEYQLQLQYCNQSQLDINKFVCANQTTIQKFYLQQNFFKIKIYVQQFDIKKKQLTKIAKQYFIDMREGYMQYQQFYLQASTLTLDDGFLFPNDKKINYFSNLQLTTLQYDDAYAKKYYGQVQSSILYFVIDTLKEESNLEYPKISEILADTGSIITFIMQISFLVSKYNENLCISKTKKEVIKMYYSDYSQFSVIKNWKGQIVQVRKNGEWFQQKKILDFFSKLDSIAVQKINYLNLQYEVSKLQILMTNLLELDQIKSYLKQTNLRQISQLIQMVKGGEDQPNQSFINKILPQNEKMSIQNGKQEINTEEVFEDDLKKSIALLVLGCEELNELEALNYTNSKGEIQVINLENNSIQ